jgi:hypothetical protein
VIRAEALQASIDLVHDGTAGQTGTVRAWPHPTVHLGRNHDLTSVREVLNGPPKDVLAGTIRIDVRRVEEVDACI